MLIQILKTKFPDISIKRVENGLLLASKNRYELLNFLITHPEIAKINIMRTFIEIEFGLNRKFIYVHNKPINNFFELKKYL